MPLPETAVITPANPFALALADSGITELLAQLDRELIGLAPVKQRIRDIAALLLVDKLRAERGFSAGACCRHSAPHSSALHWRHMRQG